MIRRPAPTDADRAWHRLTLPDRTPEDIRADCAIVIANARDGRRITAQAILAAMPKNPGKIGGQG